MVTLQPENNTLVVLIAPSILPIKPNTQSLRYSFIWQHHMLWLSCAFFLGLTDEVFLKLRIFTNKADLSCFLLTRCLLCHFPWWGVGGSRAQWQVCKLKIAKFIFAIYLLWIGIRPPKDIWPWSFYRRLFELLVLSGALAELTWPEILKRRQLFRYRSCNIENKAPLECGIVSCFLCFYCENKLNPVKFLHDSCVPKGP